MPWKNSDALDYANGWISPNTSYHSDAWGVRTNVIRRSSVKYRLTTLATSAAETSANVLASFDKLWPYWYSIVPQLTANWRSIRDSGTFSDLYCMSVSMSGGALSSLERDSAIIGTCVLFSGCFNGVINCRTCCLTFSLSVSGLSEVLTCKHACLGVIRSISQT